VPLVTLAALDLGQLLLGAVLTEQVFTIPASAS
jgi:ABC-type dipeptide/oligopeptide/nickel transport system permease component